jgi:tetratricopeptide (TPR) repeat protein
MATQRLQMLLELLESTPDDSFLLFALAKEYEGLNNPEKAMEYYLELVKKDPNYVGVYYHLGKAYEAKRQWKTAYLTYEKGMEVAGKANDQHARQELAAARLNLADDVSEVEDEV